MAQLEAPLIQIHGSPRYDLMACNIVINTVNNWSKYKTKLNLSDKETEKLYKLVKSELMINAKEVEGKNGLNLQFSKKIESSLFNNLLRQFINDFKLCTKCSTPELVDNRCNACGFIKEDKLKEKEEIKVKPKMLSKAEKDALKVEKERLEQEEKEKKKPKRKPKNENIIDLE